MNWAWPWSSLLHGPVPAVEQLPTTIRMYAMTREIAMPIGSRHRWSMDRRAARLGSWTAVVIGASPARDAQAMGRVGEGRDAARGPRPSAACRLLDRICGEVALLRELPVLRRGVVLVVRDGVLRGVAVGVEADAAEDGVVLLAGVRDVGTDGLAQGGEIGHARPDVLEGLQEHLGAGVGRRAVGARIRVEHRLVVGGELVRVGDVVDGRDGAVRVRVAVGARDVEERALRCRGAVVDAVAAHERDVRETGLGHLLAEQAEARRGDAA